MRAKCGWNGNAVYVSQPNKFDAVVRNTFWGHVCVETKRRQGKNGALKNLASSAEIYRDH